MCWCATRNWIQHKEQRRRGGLREHFHPGRAEAPDDRINILKKKTRFHCTKAATPESPKDSQQHRRRMGTASPRHATPRHATPRHATPRHATARHGMARHGTARHGTARHSTAHRDTARQTETVQQHGNRHGQRGQQRDKDGSKGTTGEIEQIAMETKGSRGEKSDRPMAGAPRTTAQVQVAPTWTTWRMAQR